MIFFKSVDRVPFQFNQFESSEDCTWVNQLPYVHFTYFNIFSEDPSGVFTNIFDLSSVNIFCSVDLGT